MLQAVVVAYRFDAVTGIKCCSTVGNVDSIWSAYDGSNEDSAVFSKLKFTQIFAAPVGVGRDLMLGEVDIMAQQSAGIGRPFSVGLELFFCVARTEVFDKIPLHQYTQIFDSSRCNHRSYEKGRNGNMGGQAPRRG